MNCTNSPKIGVLVGRKSIFIGLVAAVFLMSQACTAANADTRVALVIGNGDYKNTTKLANPRNDATDVAAALKRLGFSTIVGLDLDKAGMEDAEIRFARSARGADVAIFYYSGHAIQYAATNYLLPVDAEIKDAADLRRLAKVDDIVADLQQAKDLRILVLDSCRDNPLADELKRALGERSASVQRGLARLGSSEGMIVAYSTLAGLTADDGRGRNSPYTAAFLKEIEKPEEISTVFRRVATDVIRATENRQHPELVTSLYGDFYLGGQASPAGAVSSPPVPGAANVVATLPPSRAAAPDQIDDDTELKDPKLLFEVREKLYELNFDPGPLEGDHPDRTRTAIAQFARAASITLGEVPTYGLLRKLRETNNPKPWGAIVYAEAANKWGMSWAESTRKDAVVHATASCGKATACGAETSFFGTGCAAFAHSRKAWAIVARNNISRAKSDALEECGRKGTDCSIVASVCADGTEQFTAK
jgi:uncharacterized caspase-like protein